MTNLVTKLRDAQNGVVTPVPSPEPEDLFGEAADQIERLRACLLRMYESDGESSEAFAEAQCLLWPEGEPDEPNDAPPNAPPYPDWSPHQQMEERAVAPYGVFDVRTLKWAPMSGLTYPVTSEEQQRAAELSAQGAGWHVSYEAPGNEPCIENIPAVKSNDLSPIHRVCHELSGTCVMVLKDSDTVCTPENCASMKAAFGTAPDDVCLVAGCREPTLRAAFCKEHNSQVHKGENAQTDEE